MSQSNIDRLRAAYEAYSRREVDTDLLDPDFEVRLPASVIDTAGVFRVPKRASSSRG